MHRNTNLIKTNNNLIVKTKSIIKHFKGTNFKVERQEKLKILHVNLVVCGYKIIHGNITFDELTSNKNYALNFF